MRQPGEAVTLTKNGKVLYERSGFVTVKWDDGTQTTEWGLELKTESPKTEIVERDWCDECKDSPAGTRWLCPNRPHPTVERNV